MSDPIVKQHQIVRIEFSPGRLGQDAYYYLSRTTPISSGRDKGREAILEFITFKKNELKSHKGYTYSGELTKKWNQDLAPQLKEISAYAQNEALKVPLSTPNLLNRIFHRGSK